MEVQDAEDPADTTFAEVPYIELKDCDKKQHNSTRDQPVDAVKVKALGKVPFLDGLRGLAAILVVCQHAGYVGDVSLGEPAVDTFFVLSAFLLTSIFETKVRKLYRQQASYRQWTLEIAEYSIRRFLRVYPLFAIVACIVALLPSDLKTTLFIVEKPDDFNLFKVLVFEKSARYHVFWTLPIEIIYYVMIPPFVVVMIRLRQHWWVVALPGYVIVWVTGATVFRANHDQDWPHMPTLLCGSLAAIVHSKLQFWIAKHKFEFKMSHRLLIRAVEVVCLTIVFDEFFPAFLFGIDLPRLEPPKPGGYRFVSFHVTVIMVGELLIPGAISEVLEWQLLQHAGKVSFSMYLLHSFVIYTPWIKQQKFYTRFFTTWILLFILSSASYHLIEVPCQRLASYLGRRLREYDLDTQQRQNSSTD